MKIKIIMKIALVMTLVLFSTRGNACASEFGIIIDQELDILNLRELEKEVHKSFSPSFNLREEIKDIALSNKSYSIKDIINVTMKEIFKEVRQNAGLMGKLLVLCIMSALIKILTDSFGKGISEISFYIIYIVLIGVIFASFSNIASLSTEVLERTSNIFNISIPIMTTLLISSGKIHQATVFEPLSFTVLYITSIIIKRVLFPIIIMLANLIVIKYITEKSLISELIDGIKSVVSYVLKAIIGMSFALSGVAKLTSGMLDHTIKEGTEGLVKSFVPVMGDAISSAINVVTNCSFLLKNAVGIIIIAIFLIIIFFPVIKILAMIAVYRLAAIVVEPVADSRIVKCLREIGETCGFILSSVVMVEIIFIINITMLLGTS